MHYNLVVFQLVFCPFNVMFLVPISLALLVIYMSNVQMKMHPLVHQSPIPGIHGAH